MTATIDTATGMNTPLDRKISHEEALEIANAFVERDTSESIRNFACECTEYERNRTRINGQIATGK